MSAVPTPSRTGAWVLAGLLALATGCSREPDPAPGRPRANVERRIDLIAALDARAERAGLPAGVRVEYREVGGKMRRTVILDEGASLSWDLPGHPSPSLSLVLQAQEGDASWELAAEDGAPLSSGTVTTAGEPIQVALPATDGGRVRLRTTGGALLAASIELRSEGRRAQAADSVLVRTRAVNDLLGAMRSDAQAIERVDDLWRRYPLPDLDTVEQVAVVDLPFVGRVDGVGTTGDELAMDLYLLPAPTPEPGARGRVRITDARGASWLEAEAPLDGNAPRIRRVVSTSGDAQGLELRIDGPAESRALLLRMDLQVRDETPRALASPERPNLLLVLVDTLGARHLDAYGYERETAPRLTALAESGVLYERCFAPSPWTWPSTATLMTGLYPLEHGVVDYVETYLTGSVDTLAETLAANGVTCAAFSASPLICIGRNFDQGFESFYEDFYAPTSVLAENVEAFLDERGDERWFAYIHSLDPHLPYRPAEPHASAFGDGQRSGDWSLLQRAHHGALVDIPGDVHRSALDLYDGEIRAWDAALGRLLDGLVARGLDDRTIVVVTADHGEAFGQHGRYGHGSDLYDETLHVPLVIAAPSMPGPIRIPESVSLVDVLPTLLTAMGVEGGVTAALPPFGRMPEDRVLFSSTRIAVRGELGANRITLFSARSGDRKYVTSDTGAAVGELYDLASDPDERDDLATEGELDPEGARLRNALEAWLRDGGRLPEQGDVEEMDDETRRLLESIGYVDSDD